MSEHQRDIVLQESCIFLMQDFQPSRRGKRQDQLATFRASSASPVGIPPIVHERLCHHVLACVFIPLVKIE